MENKYQKIKDITEDIKNLCIKHDIAAMQYPTLVNKDHPDYIKFKDQIIMNLFLIEPSKEEHNGALLTPSDFVDPTQFKFFADYRNDKLYFIKKMKAHDENKQAFIKTGECYKGVITQIPTVGESFRLAGFNGMYTSTVTELLDDTIEFFTFKTENSIYKLTKLN